jgi:pteridine reductase
MRALVTGSGVRLGRATALALARAGYDLYLHTHQTPVDTLVHEIRTLGRSATVITADLTADLTPFSAVQELDLLVNNAGIFDVTPFTAIKREQHRHIQAINAEAPFFLTQALLPALWRSRAPSIVNITDVLVERTEPGLSSYAMSKAALISLTKTLAVELAPKIRVNAISPGTALFPTSHTPEQRAQALVRVPLRREGGAEDIAHAVLFLAQSPYVTGCILPVDGGRTAW